MWENYLCSSSAVKLSSSSMIQDSSSLRIPRKEAWFVSNGGETGSDTLMGTFRLSVMSQVGLPLSLGHNAF